MADAKTTDKTGAGAEQESASEKPGSVEEHGDYADKPVDGVFSGNVRYEGTVLVDREIDGQIVSVMTDKPREGDRVQATTYDERTGEFVPSTSPKDKDGATRMPGKS